jgi:DNA-directed RNA polymerase subunit omega
MARTMIEDCLAQFPCRFALTRIAAKRARQLARGAEATLPWDDHKSTVLALQEIAAGQITASILDEADLPALQVESPKFEFERMDI